MENQYREGGLPKNGGPWTVSWFKEGLVMKEGGGAFDGGGGGDTTMHRKLFLKKK